MNPARLAILGTPIHHSLSPIMQNAALEAMHLPFSYEAIEVKSEELEVTLRSLVEKNYLGLNITLPHKQHALTLMDDISEHARLLGSVNTVLIREEKLHGTNTDGPGFIAAIKEEFNTNIKNLRVLILGANGGTGRGLATQSLLDGCSTVTLAGRNQPAIQEQAAYLATMFPEQSANIKTASLETDALAKKLPEVDLVVNATPLGLNQEDPTLIPSSLFHRDQLFYDTTYAHHESAMIKAAKEAGARTANGFSMLLHQGALSFEFWFEHQAPLNPMRKALQAYLENKKFQ